MQVHRSQLKGAPYNPRSISAPARRKLKLGIKKLGMLGPIIWNKRSGNIVGGHQRLGIMDQLQHGQSYQVTVAAVDLDEKEEREGNLLLNNAGAMGEFDVAKLEAVLSFPDLDVEAAGWDRGDIHKIFGAIGEATAEATDEAAGAMAEAVKATTDKYKEMVSKSFDKNDDQFYMVVVFKNHDARKAFCDAADLEDNRFQSAEDIIAMCAPSAVNE